MSNRVTEKEKVSLWARLKRLMVTDVGALARGLNAGDVEQLERVMLESDFGLPATAELVDWIEGEIRKGRLKTDVDLRQAMSDRLTAMLTGASDPGVLARADKPPSVVLVVGVNGVGKTTSIAKLAKRLLREKETVLLAAGDTYRAGAIQQINVWADRLGIQCVSGAPGGDPAAVAFDAIEAAEKRGISRVIVDTAGRLHTQEGLMEELRKVARVIGRRAPGGPHETLLVLDGTVGQNAVQQGKLFTQAVPVSGLVVTKLDGTARGGAVVALRRELDVPVRFLGRGEKAEDLEVFDARRFAEELLES
ncbi:MAG TPA: signal recognition particle-docking protein FtsY [Gemmatimonadales bacterium]|nr:signal recognition particle-docking protein FtsY [Gemmatimonadales bacterium]